LIYARPLIRGRKICGYWWIRCNNAWTCKTHRGYRFFVDDSPENITRLKKALSSIYHDPSIEELKPDEIRQYAVIRYGTPDDFYIDFIGMIGEVFSFKDIERDMEIFEIDNIKIPVCGLETLIKMKETMRERDMRDLIFRNEKRLDDFTPCYPWHCSYPF